MATKTQSISAPSAWKESVDKGKLILRDGSAAIVRITVPEDKAPMQEFFHRLSPESRERRFFSVTEPLEDWCKRLCDSSNPAKQLSLVVIRHAGGQPRIIAAGSYTARDEKTAEVSFAVDDAYQGKSIGALLLERLAILAAKNGFLRFWALIQTYNEPMIEVFEKSGFKMKRELEGSCFEVELSIIPSEASAARSEMLDKVFTAASLRPFFHPRSVAVIGASRDPASIGYRIFQAIRENHFQGAVYAINRQGGIIGSTRAYTSIQEIPEPIDMAVISVPREAVLSVVDDCGTKGVRSLVVITAGFAESDSEGVELQRQLVDKIRGYGMRMVGPNCMGLINTNPRVSLNASFSPVYPLTGRIAMSSQSGALGLAILALAKSRLLGLSSFVSVGNKTDVSGNDLLQYWEEDPETDLILLYLESFGNPRRFARIARRISRKKTIIAVKSGRTKAGKRAAGSHTAALAGSDTAVEALFEQTGVIRAETLEEMFDLAVAFSTQPLPKGRRVAILTNAGGPAILCTDACEVNGIKVPELSQTVKAELSAFLPKAASVANPIDMIASATPEHYTKAVRTLLCADEIDALILIYIPVMSKDLDITVQAIKDGIVAARAAGVKNKPILSCLMVPGQESAPFSAGNEIIPAYKFPETAAFALSRMAAYGEWRDKPTGRLPNFEDVDPEKARTVCRDAFQSRGDTWLSGKETRDVLEAMKLPVPRGGIATTADEAIKIAKEVGFPVAIKVSSRQIIHKTDIGGVELNLKDENAVTEAFGRIKKKVAAQKMTDAFEGVLVQPMLSDGVELMAGVTSDPLFGPLIAFGLGGIHVEILGDVQFRVTPLMDQDAHSMIESIHGYKLLQGYRGHKPADVEAVQELLLRLSRLVDDVPEILELDLNPIFAFAPGKGCSIVDARIRVGDMNNAATRKP